MMTRKQELLVEKKAERLYQSLRLVLSENGTIFSRPLLISCKRNKNIGTFWSEVHFKPMTNQELSNTLAHDVNLVLSFITMRKFWNPRDSLRSLITSGAPSPASSSA